MSDKYLPDQVKSDHSDRETKLDLHKFIADNHRTSKYSVEEKLHAVMTFIVLGSMAKTAEATGVPLNTLKDWRHTANWWDTVLHELRKRNQDELDARITGLIDKATEGIEDRISNGDARLTKTGDVTRVPVDGRSLATIMGILFDKRAAIRGDPITHNSNTSGAEQIQRLEDKFKDFARKMDQSGALAKPIDGEIVDEEPNSSED